MAETPKLVKVMILKGGVYLFAGLALFPGSLLLNPGKLAAVLAILSTFFSLAAALGFFASRTGIFDDGARRTLLVGAVVALACALGQGVYGIAELIASAPSATP